MIVGGRESILVVTPSTLLADRVRRDSGRPLVVWYGESGARVELSAVTAANWAAKVGNHLCLELDLHAGDAVALTPTLTWQALVVSLGTWTAGGCIDLAGGLVAVATATTNSDSDLPVGADPLGGQLSAVVAAQPDVYVGAGAVEPDALALVSDVARWTHAELATQAVAARSDTAVLVTPGDPVSSYLALLAAVAGGGRLVVADTGADPAVARRNEGL